MPRAPPAGPPSWTSGRATASSGVYAVVDELPGIRESLVVGAELPDGDY
ncbi:hypothetical protein [Streptomyces sp. NPDC091040]